MKAEILAAVKTMIAADPSVKGEQLELIMLALEADPEKLASRIETSRKVLSGDVEPAELPPLFRRAQAAYYLQRNVRTIDNYIRTGILEGVRGRGERIIGVRRGPVIRMMMESGLDPSVVPLCPPPVSRRRCG